MNDLLEAEMYPLFSSWLEKNSDAWMQEPLIPATAAFDFIALRDGHVVVYELKVSNAKQVIYQANMSCLWSDHAYAVLPADKIHLGLKYKDMLHYSTGLMSLDMATGVVRVVIEPESKQSHQTHCGLRQDMIDWIIRDYVNTHLSYVAAFRQVSYDQRVLADKKARRRPRRSY